MTTSFRVIAIVSAFNEGDIISAVIRHLIENGIGVYLLDNRSTDDTVAQAKPWLGKGLLEIETFPAQAPEGGDRFDWTAILRRKEDLTRELQADWFMHHDADEIREAPFPGMSLRDAIRWVDLLNYNTIDFRVLNFAPLAGELPRGADLKAAFTRWEEPALPDTFQLKCWKATAAPVSIAVSGGHLVSFPGQRVFPIKFLMRHYPIRGPEHGRRKVFEERKNRFVDSERAIGWHTQYDEIRHESHSFLPDPSRLHPFDPDQVRLDLMMFHPAYIEARECLERLRQGRSERDDEASRERESRLRELSAELGRREAEATDLRLRLDEARTREEGLVSQLNAADGHLQAALRSQHDLRTEIERQDRFRLAVERSTAWRWIQAVRRLFGRAW